MQQDNNSRQDKNSSSAPERPQQNGQQGQREGDYRNVETSAGKPSDFGDDYEVEQENKIAEEDVRTEKEGRDGKR